MVIDFKENYSVHSYPYPTNASRCEGSFDTFEEAQKEYNRFCQLETKGCRSRNVAKDIRFWPADTDHKNQRYWGHVMCPVCGDYKNQCNCGAVV